MSVSRTNDYGNYGGRWPAIVREYDPETRLCRIEIPGITDGADPLPNAEIEYPIGDRSRKSKEEEEGSARPGAPLAGGGAGAPTTLTEIEILPGDAVWVAFIGGDPRYPLITGYRNARVENDTDWRRWHHANVEVIADAQLNLLSSGSLLADAAGTAHVNAGSVAQMTSGYLASVDGAAVAAMSGGAMVRILSGGVIAIIGGSVAIIGSRVDLNPSAQPPGPDEGPDDEDEDEDEEDEEEGYWQTVHPTYGELIAWWKSLGNTTNLSYDQLKHLYYQTHERQRVWVPGKPPGGGDPGWW